MVRVLLRPPPSRTYVPVRATRTSRREKKREPYLASRSRISPELREEYERLAEERRDAERAYESAVHRYESAVWEWDFVRDDLSAPHWQLDGAWLGRDQCDDTIARTCMAKIEAREREFECYMRVLAAIHARRHEGPREPWEGGLSRARPTSWER